MLGDCQPKPGELPAVRPSDRHRLGAALRYHGESGVEAPRACGFVLLVGGRQFRFAGGVPGTALSHLECLKTLILATPREPDR